MGGADGKTELRRRSVKDASYLPCNLLRLVLVLSGRPSVRIE